MRTGIFTSRSILLGIASWIAPFLAAVPFYGPQGQLAVPEPLFKSLMVVVGGAFGAWFLVLAFRHLSANIKTGLSIGLFWLGINVVLDLAILLPLSGQGFGEWFQAIGLRYLTIPVMAMAMGAVAKS